MTNKIRVNKNQLAYFRRVARKAHPLEVQSYLVGNVVSPTLAVVVRFEYTNEYSKQGTGDINWTDEEFQRIKKKAEEEGLNIIGDIHSHPNYWPILSSHDYKNHITGQQRVSGVYGYLGKKSMVCFWVSDTSLPLEIEYDDKKL